MEGSNTPKVTSNNFWYNLAFLCVDIVNSTAPGDCITLKAEDLDLLKEVTRLTPRQAIRLAKAMQTFEEERRKEAREARVRA